MVRSLTRSHEMKNIEVTFAWSLCNEEFHIDGYLTQKAKCLINKKLHRKVLSTVRVKSKYEMRSAIY